jgi:hypothetical protein
MSVEWIHLTLDKNNWLAPVNTLVIGEIWGSHSYEYEDGQLPEYCSV